MFSLTSSNTYYLYKGYTDMRKSFDGLSGLVQNQMGRNPLSGEVFLFINRKKDSIKLLRWENGGYVVYYKRLEKGTLAVPKSLSGGNYSSLGWSELVLMIEGILVEKYRKKARYSLAETGKNISQNP